MVTRPESGRSSVVRMRTAVVLPAPLGPSMPSTVPRGTEKSMPRSACTLPKDLCSPETSMARSVFWIAMADEDRASGAPSHVLRSCGLVEARDAPHQCHHLRCDVARLPVTARVLVDEREPGEHVDGVDHSGAVGSGMAGPGGAREQDADTLEPA